MTVLATPETRVTQLERQVLYLQRAAIALACTLLVVVVAGFRTQQPAEATVLRARGLVIVDSAGRERILIGAPIPYARSRVRTDSLRVAREWARAFPDSAKYMEWYRGYRHTMHGMLVLDERGFDRLVVGDSNPDPNVGRRIGPATGIEVNDARGFERTGYGMLTVDGSDRVVLGLDGKNGTEGATLSLIDGGRVGPSIHGRQQRLVFLGTMLPDGRLGLSDTTNGLVLARAQRVAHRYTTDAPRR